MQRQVAERRFLKVCAGWIFAIRTSTNITLMKTHARWTLTLAMIAGANWIGTLGGIAADNKKSEAEEMMNLDDPEMRQAAAAREKDPAWKPACAQVRLIQVGNRKNSETLSNFCLDADGNILACIASNGDVKS